jgi:hypothetical protein
MLPLWYQGLSLPNPNIDALSKKIHLLQSHWDTGSTLGKSIRHVRCFRLGLVLVAIFSHNLLLCW